MAIDVTLFPNPPISAEILSKPPIQVVIKPGLAVGSGGDVTFGITSTLDVAVTAAEPLGLYRAVTQDGYHCVQNETSLSKYAGITTAAMTVSEERFVIQSGLITEPGWTWTPDQPIFVGTNGILTQSPNSGPIRRIGWAISVTQINLDPFPIIKGA